MLSPSRKAELLLLVLTFIWGATFPLVKTALNYSSPFVFVIIRFGLAALVFWLIFSKNIYFQQKAVLKAGAVIGIFLFLGYAFQTMGLKYTAASKSAFITGLFVVLIPPLSFVILKEKMRIFSVIGVILAVSGLYLLTRPKGSEFNLGDLLTFFCAVSFSFQVIFVQIYTKKYDFFTLTLVQILVTTLLSFPFMFLLGGIKLVYHPHLLWAIFVCAILATALALYIQNRMQRDTTAVKAALIYAMEPVFAAVFSYLLLGEILGWPGILGGGLILSGMLCSELGKR
ncbi:MAG: EamA family transporter [candidate division Zixibacteria bacterium]|nr:EamA family transporter [candidate division Zixibacteria bacterium]